MLVEKNLEIAATIADTSMLWWVSSVVFCGSLLGVLWWHGETVVRRLTVGQLRWVGFVVLVFLLSFLAYPSWVIYSLCHLDAQTSELLEGLGQAGHHPLIFQQIVWALVIGMVSFLLIVISWIRLYAMLRRLQEGAKSAQS